MGKLTALGVKSLTKPGRYTDGEGLHLHVRGPDRRAWVLRFMIRGHSRDMGLGSYPEVNLAEARERAAQARRMIRDGNDPLAARKDAEATQLIENDRTFKAATEELLADMESGWRNDKHRAQWRSTLETYAYPVLGTTPVHQVDSDAVMRVLRPLWTRAPETGSRLRRRIEAVFDSAKARGWHQGENPARWKGHLSVRLPSPRKVKAVRHQPALAWQEIGRFLVALREREGVAARAVETAILTAARSSEVRGMTWGELDLCGVGKADP